MGIFNIGIYPRLKSGVIKFLAPGFNLGFYGLVIFFSPRF